MTQDIRQVPAIRAIAEERTGTLVEAMHAHRGMLSDHTHGAMVETYIDLLCDLSRPDSRDAVARLVAAKVGIECGATAPDFARFVCGEHCCDGNAGEVVKCDRPIWSLMGADETQMVTFADCPDPDEWDGDERRHVPDISAITDPAEALARVALKVLA